MEIVCLVNPLNCGNADSTGHDADHAPLTDAQLAAFVQGFPIEGA